jgi:arylsulfatase A-like enzyme
MRVHMVDKLPAKLTPLAEVFSTAGYATAGLYSWLSLDPVYCGFERGFQVYQNIAGQAPGLLSAPALRQVAADYRVAEEFLAVPRAASWLIGYQDQIEADNKGRADVTTDAAIAQLKVLAGQPFFLWVHYFDAHYPYIPPAGFAEQYDPNYSGSIDGSIDTVDAIQSGKLDPQGADLARLKSLYQGELTFLDQQLARLFSAIDGLNLSDNTVVALTADHGEAFGEHPEMVEGVPFFHPHSLHNEEIHTPLLLRYPGQIKAGAVVQAPTQAIDIFPTLLDLAGLKVPDQNQGASLVRLLDGSDDGTQRATFSAMPDYTFTSLIVPGWKLVQNNPGGDVELFDLAHDPGETHDLGTAEPDIARQMEAKVNDWMKANNVQ